MDKRIAILRGINVGGKRKILMADLKLLFEDLGFSNVETYIQSGNVIFNTVNKLTDIEIADNIEKNISEKYEFDVSLGSGHIIKYKDRKWVFHTPSGIFRILKKVNDGMVCNVYR